MRRFLRHYRFSFWAKTRQGQQTNGDSERVRDDFAKTVINLARPYGVSRVYNADQTELNHEYLPKHTIHSVGAARV